MKSSLLLAGFLLAGSPALAADWTIQPAASSLTFTGTETGASFTGSFGSWGGQISYDPAKPQEAHVHLTIALASAKSGDAQRDQAMPGSDWFDVSAFPQAVFDATGFTPQGGDKFLANGTLTIRGVKKPVSLPFTLDVTGDKAVAKGKITLTRTDFGVGQGAWSSGDYVGLQVDVAFTLTASS